MSTTLEDAAYEMYLEDLYEQDLKHQTIEEFRLEILGRYYSKNPLILKRARDANLEAVKLYKETHYSASLTFNFCAIELLVKEVIIRPLLHGNVIQESVADYITEEIVKNMKNYSHYSKLFTQFITTYTQFDPKDYKGENLLKEFEALQKDRNGIVHDGEQADKRRAFEANKVSTLFYQLTVEIMQELGLEVDKKTWSIIKK